MPVPSTRWRARNVSPSWVRTAYSPASYVTSVTVVPKRTLPSLPAAQRQ